MYYYSEFDDAFLKQDYELVAIGNSRLLASIDKSVLEKELNLKTALLGYSSANISISFLILESYLNNCSTLPKVIILEVSWVTFDENRTAFHAFSGDLMIKDTRLVKYIFRYWPKLLQNYIASIFNQIKPNLSNKTSITFESRSEKSNPQEKSYIFEKNTFEKIFPSHVSGMSNLLIEDFYSIVDLCKKNNLQLILYSSPEDKDYSLLQENKVEIIKIFNDISSSKNNIYFLDYTMGGNLYDKKFEYWLRDSDHINDNDLFTLKLTQDIKELDLF